MENKSKDILLNKGYEILKRPKEFISFTGKKEADKYLNDLENYPHIFVLACIMDRQIKAERAWEIPYLVSKELNSFNFDEILKFPQEKFVEIFEENKLHRFNKEIAKSLYLALKDIKEKYGGDASNIWKNYPSSATVVRRFLEFRGSGIKISTMFANILARSFKIPMKDHYCIDISPDIQIRRVFTRLGYIKEGDSNEIIIYKARELNPEYPGVFDYSCWFIGRDFCHPKNPDCGSCPLNGCCEYLKKVN